MALNTRLYCSLSVYGIFLLCTIDLCLTGFHNPRFSDLRQPSALVSDVRRFRSCRRSWKGNPSPRPISRRSPFGLSLPLHLAGRAALLPRAAFRPVGRHVARPVRAPRSCPACRSPCGRPAHRARTSAPIYGRATRPRAGRRRSPDVWPDLAPVALSPSKVGNLRNCPARPSLHLAGSAAPLPCGASGLSVGSLSVSDVRRVPVPRAVRPVAVRLHRATRRADLRKGNPSPCTISGQRPATREGRQPRNRSPRPAPRRTCRPCPVPRPRRASLPRLSFALWPSGSWCRRSPATRPALQPVKVGNLSARLGCAPLPISPPVPIFGQTCRLWCACPSCCPISPQPCAPRRPRSRQSAP